VSRDSSLAGETVHVFVQVRRVTKSYLRVLLSVSSLFLGMRFALTQLKAALVEVVRNFNIKPNPKTRKDNVLDETFFMATLKGGIWLDYEARK